MTVTVAEADRLIQTFLRKRGFPVASLPEDIEIERPLKRARRQGKSVRFSSKLVTQTYDDSSFDIENLWYQRHEYANFMQDCRKLLIQTREEASVGLVKEIDDGSYRCIRGLEDHLMPSLYVIKRKRKKCLIRTIVRQYQINKNQAGGAGPPDSEILRSISTMFSYKSLSSALEMALLDAQHR